jgi:hypothetical protein
MLSVLLWCLWLLSQPPSCFVFGSLMLLCCHTLPPIDCMIVIVPWCVVVSCCRHAPASDNAPQQEEPRPTRALPPRRNEIGRQFQRPEIRIEDDPRQAMGTREQPISSLSCASVSAILIGRRDAAHIWPTPPTRRRPDDATTCQCSPQTHQTTGRCLVTTSSNGTVGCVWKISVDMFVTGSYGKKMDGRGRRRNGL